MIPAKGMNNIGSLSWTTDGKALFVSNVVKGGGALYHVGLNGNIQFLWKSDIGGESGEIDAVESPDGKHIAIKALNVSSNVWMMENF